MSKKPANQPATKVRPLKSQNLGRRLMDNNAGLSNIPDRRIKNAERRDLETVSHSSPVRRYTIDRRTGIKDRRAVWNKAYSHTRQASKWVMNFSPPFQS